MLSPSDRRTLLLSGTGLGLIFGTVLGAWAWQQYGFRTVLTVPARRVALSELIRNDSGETRHVEVTDLVFSDGYVFEENAGQWSKVFVPIFPADGRQHNEIHAVVESWDIRSEAELQELFQRDSVSGIVAPERSGLGVTVAPMLARANPGVRVNDVWRIHTIRVPPTVNSIRVKTFGAVACLLAGCLCLVAHRRGSRAAGRELQPQE